MVAKCVALLAVVAQLCYVASASCVSSYGTTGVIGTGVVGTGIVGSGVVGSGLVGSGLVGSGLVGTTGVVGSGLVGTTGVVGSGLVGTTGVVGSGVVGTSGVVGSGLVGTSTASTASRNIVARGKYPVAMDNCGPVPDPRVPISTSHVQAPVQEKPTIRLPARIPAPRTVAHSCTCYKTIMRPRVHDQYITVPSVQRYIETTHRPVVENIHYEAVPVNCASTLASSGAIVGGSVASAVPVASSGAIVGGSVASAVPVASSGAIVGGSVASAIPVASSVGALSTGYGVSQLSALPVATAVPVTSAVQVGSVYPYSTGCQTAY